MNELEWIDLESSALASVAYDPETEVIYIRFQNGGTYAYDECPPHVWEELTARASLPGNSSTRRFGTSRTKSLTRSRSLAGRWPTNEPSA
jgi:hypothetical protein